jgi:uncharacterized protein (TIGR02271 family)
MDSAAGDSAQRIPVASEELEVGRRKVTTGYVRVRTTVHERVAEVHETAMCEEAVIERVPINRYVDAPEPPREEGDLLIVPVHEEVVTIERKWLLKEEVRIRRDRREEPVDRQVVLREEQAQVKRGVPDP